MSTPNPDTASRDRLARVVDAVRRACGSDARTVETHAAIVVIGADTALKIKRPVRYDYLDFSTLESREAALRRELELNRPHAPMIYRDVVPLTEGPDGSLTLDGLGEPVEWVLRMARFDTGSELAHIADRDGISGDLADRLGAAIARYHAASPTRADDGSLLIAAILDELKRVFADMGASLGAARIAEFHRRAEGAFEAISPILSERGRKGYVRRCHGDLHLGNIVLIDDEPVMFDALEFDETLGTCDVLYDLAFLAMDLWHRGERDAANRVLNAYLQTSDDASDLAGLAAFPLFVAIRAAIRAMVEVQTDTVADGDRTHRLGQRYLDLAILALEPAAPILVAVGGLSGTGKTSLARRLAPHTLPVPGAIHLRADLIRKRLFSVAPTTKLPEEAYAGDVNVKVQDILRDRAADTLAAGYSAIADTTFMNSDDRAAVERLAAENHAGFVGIWLTVPVETALERVSGRIGDASDADEAVVLAQTKADTGPMSWSAIDTSPGEDEVLSAALRLVERAQPKSGTHPRGRSARSI